MRIDAIVSRIKAVPFVQGRRIIAIAGAPASGKSTLAEALLPVIRDSCVIPMDGFHCDNDDLREHGLFECKGAPDTFDAEGYVRLVSCLRHTPSMDIPTFDRKNDCTVPAGFRLTADKTTLILEGNYLMLNRAPWKRISELVDLTFMVDVPFDTLQVRLIQRWLDHGLTHQQAADRAYGNDIPNAKTVIDESIHADVVIAGMDLI